MTSRRPAVPPSRRPAGPPSRRPAGPPARRPAGPPSRRPAVPPFTLLRLWDERHELAAVLMLVACFVGGSGCRQP
ncbi:MAG: hypothetical protein HY744_27195 [Deltaproteobacteria bacterium]|nr:hypothetical protein [Deltaproteobacteria bacterium]